MCKLYVVWVATRTQLGLQQLLQYIAIWWLQYNTYGLIKCIAIHQTAIVSAVFFSYDIYCSLTLTNFKILTYYLKREVAPLVP